MRMHIYEWGKVVDAELIILAVSVIATIVSSTSILAYWLGRQFTEIRLRLTILEERVSRLEERVTKLEERVSKLEERVRKLEDRVGTLERKIEDLSRNMDRKVKAISAASVEAHRLIVDFLSIKGILERDEMEYLSRRVEGIFHTYASAVNPLTKEELKFLKEFFAKDPDLVTEEEAERAYEIGKRLFVEDADPNGYLIAIAAAYRRGYLVSKRVRERKKKEKEKSEKK